MTDAHARPGAPSGARSWAPIFVCLVGLSGGLAFPFALGLDAETVMPLFLVGVLFALVFVGLELRRSQRGFRASRRLPALNVEHTFAPEGSVTLTGGCRIGWSPVSSPLVRLTADRDYVQLRSPIRTVWIPRPWVVAVHRAPGVGIMFRTANGDFDGVAFTSSSTDHVLAALADLDWPVDAPR